MRSELREEREVFCHVFIGFSRDVLPHPKRLVSVFKFTSDGPEVFVVLIVVLLCSKSRKSQYADI